VGFATHHEVAAQAVELGAVRGEAHVDELLALALAAGPRGRCGRQAEGERRRGAGGGGHRGRPVLRALQAVRQDVHLHGQSLVRAPSRHGRPPDTRRRFVGRSVYGPGLYGVVGAGVLSGVSTLCAVVPPAGLYGVVGTGALCDVSTLCAVVPPPGLYGVVGTGVLWDVSTLCAVAPPAGPYRAWSLLLGLRSRGWSSRLWSHASPCLNWVGAHMAAPSAAAGTHPRRHLTHSRS
jgi:hypothetical protein